MRSHRATPSTCPRLAALLLLLVAAPARAATQHEPLLGLGAEVRYDSDARAGGGADVMSKLTPRIGYRMRSERRQLEVGYGLDMIHYAEAGNFGFDHRATLAWRERLSRRLRLKLDGMFYRVEDTSALPRFGIVQVRTGALWMTGNLAATYSFSHRSTLEAGWRAEATQLLTGGAPFGAVNAFSAQARELLSRRLEVGLGYRFQLFTSDQSRYADAHAASLSGRYRLARHTFVLLEAGPMLYRSQQPTALDARWRAQLEHDARGLDLALVAGHDYLGAGGYATAIWADFAQLAVTWRLYEHLMLFGAGGAYRNGVAPRQPTDALGYGLSLGGEWRFSRSLTAACVFDHIGQVGLGGTQGLTMARNIVSLRAAYHME